MNILFVLVGTRALHGQLRIRVAKSSSQKTVSPKTAASRRWTTLGVQDEFLLEG
jgi:hypothetical protein